MPSKAVTSKCSAHLHSCGKIFFEIASSESWYLSCIFFPSLHEILGLSFILNFQFYIPSIAVILSLSKDSILNSVMHPLAITLSTDTEVPCVSIYIPVLKGLGHATENATRLHRALDEAESRLQQFGIEGKAQKQFVGHARAFADNDLTQGIGAGTLAIFLSPATFEVMHLPVENVEHVVTGTHFFLTPILPFLYGTLHYYLLAVSKNSAHFLEVRDGEIEAIEIPNMPKSVEDAWAGMERDEQSLQTHSSGGGTAAFHGQGGAKDEKEVEVTVYLQKIAKSLHTFLHEQHAPMIFVGVQELFGIYHKLDTSGRLLSSFIHGSPEHIEAEELLAKADPIIREDANAFRLKQLEGYGNVAGTGKTSTDLAFVLDAAAIGKVDLLFVAEKQEQWGVFDSESGRKELHEAATATNQELLGLTALHTLRHKGHVVTLPLELMPEGKQVAAVLRY